VSGTDLVDSLGTDTFPAGVTNTIAVNSNATTVTTGAATGISNTGATLNGSLTGLGTADDSLVAWHLNSTGRTLHYGNRYPASGTTSSTLPLSFNANVGGLTPNTLYYYIAQGQYGTPTQTVTGLRYLYHYGGGGTLPTLTSLNPNSGAPGATLTEYFNSTN